MRLCLQIPLAGAMLSRDRDGGCSPVRDLTLRIHLSGTTTAALVPTGEFVRIRTGFARGDGRTAEQSHSAKCK